MTETTPPALRLPISIDRSRRWRLLPVMEIVVLAIGALLPLVLADYLTIYATRVLILCLFALGILVLVYLLCRFLVGSHFGLALAGLRENEQRITFFGYRVQRLKAIIFSFAGAIAGLAGSLYAFHEGFVWPNML